MDLAPGSYKQPPPSPNHWLLWTKYCIWNGSSLHLLLSLLSSRGRGFEVSIQDLIKLYFSRTSKQQLGPTMTWSTLRTLYKAGLHNFWPFPGQNKDKEINEMEECIYFKTLSERVKSIDIWDGLSLFCLFQFPFTSSWLKKCIHSPTFALGLTEFLPLSFIYDTSHSLCMNTNTPKWNIPSCFIPCSVYDWKKWN